MAQAQAVRTVGVVELGDERAEAGLGGLAAAPLLLGAALVVGVGDLHVGAGAPRGLRHRLAVHLLHVRVVHPARRTGRVGE